MRRPITRHVVLPFVLALVTAACDDSVTTTTPTEPTPPATTEVFNGTINPNGAFTHTFSTARSGSVTATLNSLSPDASLRTGLSLGTWNGFSCQNVITKDDAVVGNSIVGSVSSAGNLCVRVYDVGSFVEPTSYEVQVVHP